MAALACLRDQGAWAGLLLCSPALGLKMSLKLRCRRAGCGAALRWSCLAPVAPIP